MVSCDGGLILFIFKAKMSIIPLAFQKAPPLPECSQLLVTNGWLFIDPSPLCVMDSP